MEQFLIFVCSTDKNCSLLFFAILIPTSGNTTNNAKFIERVLCGRENFEEGRQIFKFRFYSLGKWVTVEVDDKLPTKIYEQKSEDCLQKN